jgi:hypothetical protein
MPGAHVHAPYREALAWGVEISSTAAEGLDVSSPAPEDLGNHNVRIASHI